MVEVEVSEDHILGLLSDGQEFRTVRIEDVKLLEEDDTEASPGDAMAGLVRAQSEASAAGIGVVA